jgi:L-iditol 2-dehydrogenase
MCAVKVVRVTGVGAVHLLEMERPRPLAGEVTVRVQAVGICGTDLEIISGSMTYYTDGLASYPITIGHEWVGEVAEIGPDTVGFTEGNRVVGEVSIGCMACEICRSGSYHRCGQRTETGVMNRDGALAEFVVLPAWALHHVSKGIDLRAAALVEPTAIAFNGIKLAGVGPGKSVLIVGDGPIGLLLVQIARAVGADRVVLAGADDKRLALGTRFGADATVDVRQGLTLAAIHTALCGKPANIVLEASGNPKGVETAIAAASPGATILLQGLCGCTSHTPFDFDRIVVNDLTLRGALGSPGLWPGVIRLIESGEVDPAALVTHELPMSKFADALDIVRARKAVKLILRPSSD